MFLMYISDTGKTHEIIEKYYHFQISEDILHGRLRERQ